VTLDLEPWRKGDKLELLLLFACCRRSLDREKMGKIERKHEDIYYGPTARNYGLGK